MSWRHSSWPESVAPSSFHLSGRLISCHCIALGILV
ncbi:hypothetical protein Gotur_030309 [Gossypium turneri]